MREGKGIQQPTHPTPPHILPTGSTTYPHHMIIAVHVCMQDRAIARLATEREMNKMQEEHEEKIKIYKEKAREIHEKCVIGDNRIKELRLEVRAGSEPNNARGGRLI